MLKPKVFYHMDDILYCSIIYTFLKIIFNCKLTYFKNGLQIKLHFNKEINNFY